MESSALQPATPRFAHLDGLRGLAALFVVLHHAYVEVAWSRPGLPGPIVSLMRVFEHGTLAVDVFIVLSGFVLMMPVLTSRERSPRGGLAGFFKRRARRILPAYYGALLISLALIATVPALAHKTGDRWDAALPVSFGSVASHLLLIHNVSRDWIWKIDNPMWSVATEWQIYFVFALVLLPVWRRLGMLAALCVAMTCGAVIEFFTPGDCEARFHFIGLFAFGMVAAHVVVQRREARWNWISSATCFGLCAMIALAPALTSQPKIIIDLIIGAASAVIITSTASLEALGQTGPLNRLLGSTPIRKLGEFSYSLYLMHFPLLALGHKQLRSLNLTPTTNLLIMLFGVVPMTMLCCWGFYCVFDRPFMKKLTPAVGAALTDGAGSSENIRLAA